MSQMGPLAEIHDASPEEGPPFALFGFVGVPPAHRQDETVLRHAVLAQLSRIFGPQAFDPDALYLKDWAFDPYTANELDHQPLLRHPAYADTLLMRGFWSGRLLLAGSEMAPRTGGYLEGALEAAEAVFARLSVDRA